MALGRRYLVDGRSYEVRERGGDTVLARFDRERLWFRQVNNGPVTLIDDILWLREVAPSSKGREARVWVRIDKWFLAPRTAKTASRGMALTGP